MASPDPPRYTGAMIRRVLLHTLLALALVLSGLTAVVAQTRMAISGGYCGLSAPSLLLDASGLPILDDDGAAIAAPDCPACHLTVAALSAQPPQAIAPTDLLPTAALSARPLPPLSVVWLNGHARAPPRLA
ncbi:hypothetical protein [Gymnodinialimonas sp. 57CJ19]|uniref:DUF2946 family protein n=1 Tax=Gymnodinialimonas sp. 57CJ19 TaxID=3138498 RepID=UPI00313443DD